MRRTISCKRICHLSRFYDARWHELDYLASLMLLHGCAYLLFVCFVFSNGALFSWSLLFLIRIDLHTCVIKHPPHSSVCFGPSGWAAGGSNGGEVSVIDLLWGRLSVWKLKAICSEIHKLPQCSTRNVSSALFFSFLFQYFFVICDG